MIPDPARLEVLPMADCCGFAARRFSSKPCAALALSRRLRLDGIEHQHSAISVRALARPLLLCIAARCSRAIGSSTDLGVGHAVRDETIVLRPGSDQRHVGAAHHQPLREQLWRRSYPLVADGWIALPWFFVALPLLISVAWWGWDRRAPHIPAHFAKNGGQL